MNNKRGFNDIAINNSKFTGGLITGPAIILGSIAYRFAKKRRMYITLPTTFRMSIEIISIVLSILLLIMFDERSLKTYISQNPIDSGLWIGIIIAYFVMVVHNNKNDDISYKKQGENKNDTGQSNVAVAENSIHLEGVGGWLILLAFGIVAGLIRMIIGFDEDYSFYTDSILSTINSEQFSTVFGGGDVATLFWLLVYEFIGSAVFLLLWMYMTFLFFSKKERFSSLFINLNLWFLLFNLIDVYVGSTLVILQDSFGNEVYRNLAGQAFSIIIWVWYIKKSERVKNTFIN